MSTPKLDYFNAAVEWLPRRKRIKKFIRWIFSLLSQSKRLNYLYELYIEGTDADNYDFGGIYQPGDIVVYKFKVYLAKGVIGPNLPPDLHLNSWEFICDNFIGAKERSRYTANKLILEYALNRYFRTEFRQLPSISDIYIDTEDITYDSFVVGNDEAKSSKIFENSSSAYIYSVENASAASSYVFNVNIPLSVYESIGSQEVADAVIKKILDKYVPIGIDYKILIY